MKDTVQTLRAISADCIVMRHPHSGAPQLAADWLEIPVINAGDGFHEHPDARLARFADDSQSQRPISIILNVTIIGDLLHSRVARSATWGLAENGRQRHALRAGYAAATRICGLTGAHLESDCDAAIEGADVVMCLRLQQERMDGVFLPGVREYSMLYGVNETRLKRAKPDAIVMHPGPMNRGVEIAPEVADGAAKHDFGAGEQRRRGAHGAALFAAGSERGVTLF